MAQTSRHVPTRSALRIDAHHHLWRYDSAELAWITDDMAALRRDFLLADLEHSLSAANLDASVAVQARRSIDETKWLLECARTSQRIRGVVGWVPLAEPSVVETLEEFAVNPCLVGFREIAQGQSEGFFARSSFNHGIEQLTRLNLTYDILIYSQQLPETIQFVDRHPQQKFVLDHLAKPKIASGELEPWSTHLHALARRGNVSCKLSGMVTEAVWSSWTADTLRPYLQVCVDAFGPERLIAGSDWPVCLIASSYRRWWDTLADYFSDFSAAEQEAIFGMNAARVYGLQMAPALAPEHRKVAL